MSLPLGCHVCSCVPRDSVNSLLLSQQPPGHADSIACWPSRPLSQLKTTVLVGVPTTQNWKGPLRLPRHDASGLGSQQHGKGLEPGHVLACLLLHWKAASGGHCLPDLLTHPGRTCGRLVIDAGPANISVWPTGPSPPRLVV